MTMKTPGGLLALWRASQEPVVTQVELAKRLDIDGSMLSLMERDHRVPALDLAARIETVTSNGIGPRVRASSWRARKKGRAA